MILLTGGAGFIGSCLLWKLNSEGIKDIIVVDSLNNGDKWKNLRGKKYLDYIHKEVFLDAVSNRHFSKPQIVVHLGACSSTTLTDSDYYIKNNYEYSKTLAAWAFENDIPFIYASSAATYGDGADGYSDDLSKLDNLMPLNMYGYSKHIFDLWLRNNQLLDEAIGIKFFNVFGPNEYHKGDMRSIICKNYDSVSKDGIIKLFKSYNDKYEDGGQLRDFVYIKDVVEALYFLIDNCSDIGGIFNLGTGKARSWKDIAKSMFAAAGKAAKIEYIDMPDSLKNKYQYFTEADISKLRGAGFKKPFMELEDSVADYCSYLKNSSYL
ncbi:MAG: ADP-glyceromanno-heptose 6-epimerase [Elusimicrobiota bacterium]|nr:ADP-glyceromanno-heptose 6-epimerase [Elusimicrobiota bacterium]